MSHGLSTYYNIIVPGPSATTRGFGRGKLAQFLAWFLDKLSLNKLRSSVNYCEGLLVLPIESTASTLSSIPDCSQGLDRAYIDSKECHCFGELCQH